MKENKSVWGDRERDKGAGDGGEERGTGRREGPVGCVVPDRAAQGHGAVPSHHTAAGQRQESCNYSPRSACHHTPQRHLSA